MVHLTDVATWFLLASGLFSGILCLYAIQAYRRARNPALGFVAAAFFVFALKSLVVAYSLYTTAIEHETLELVDAVGDASVVMLFALPVVWPPRRKPQ